MHYLQHESQPARAVWIEIASKSLIFPALSCHSLRGLCGLKYRTVQDIPLVIQSQPARAVWIEILSLARFRLMAEWSQPARAVWIEICGFEGCGYKVTSHSLRGLCGLKSPAYLMSVYA